MCSIIRSLEQGKQNRSRHKSGRHILGETALFIHNYTKQDGWVKMMLNWNVYPPCNIPCQKSTEAVTS